jgi:hypothetical protein
MESKADKTTTDTPLARKGGQGGQQREAANGVAEAKRLLPLPELMERLGCGDRAEHNARCPFHSPDRNPSFGIFQRDDQWFWKCQAGCGQGDEITFIEKEKGLSNSEATKEFLRMARVAPRAYQTLPERSASLAVALPKDPESPKEKIEAYSSIEVSEVTRTALGQ